MKSIISDTCDVIFKRLSDNKIIFTGEAQLASLSQKIKEEKVKGGIGNRDIAVLRSDKEVELKVRNAVFDTEWMEMVSGASYTSATNTVFKTEKNLVCKTGTPNFVEVTEAPNTDGIVKIIAGDGTQHVGTYVEGSPKKVTFPTTTGVVGDLYTVVYEIDVTGNTLNIDATKFAEKYYVEYQTVEYDIDTNTIFADLYLIFSAVTPSSNFDLSFENGKAQTPEITLTALAPSGSNIIGKIIEVPRT